MEVRRGWTSSSLALHIIFWRHGPPLNLSSPFLLGCLFREPLGSTCFGLQMLGLHSYICLFSCFFIFMCLCAVHICVHVYEHVHAWTHVYVSTHVDGRLRSMLNHLPSVTLPPSWKGRISQSNINMASLNNLQVLWLTCLNPPRLDSGGLLRLPRMHVGTWNLKSHPQCCPVNNLVSAICDLLHLFWASWLPRKHYYPVSLLPEPLKSYFEKQEDTYI